MRSREEINEDVENTIGLVPSFMQSIPTTALDGFWRTMKDFEMAETAIPQKYKELIGLAVASQIPCSYCLAFHEEGARMNGASDEEMKEAIMMAAQTRQGSAIVNATQQDMAAFKDELRQMKAYLQAHSRAADPGTQKPPLAP